MCFIIQYILYGLFNIYLLEKILRHADFYKQSLHTSSNLFSMPLKYKDWFYAERTASDDYKTVLNSLLIGKLIK